MTRKLLTALVLMLIGIGQAQSNPVGRQDAMKKAQEFLQSKGKSFAASSVRRVPSNQPDDDYQPYYLFNVGNREGFVVAAGDDRVPAILGYADDGMLLPDSLPSNMKAWLELYEQQIRYIQENDIDVSSALFASNHSKINPLLTTTWDQTDPYNQSCPDFFTNGKCVTGCVATAMAQVMFYHRDNSVTKTQKTIPAYTCSTKWNTDDGTQQVQVSAVPAGSVIDWNNMLNSYSSSATTTQKKAVADLMFYCGASVSMDYADAFNGGSGAYSSDVPAALKTYFDYSDNTQLASRSSYSSDEAWDNLIYNELSQQRPVLYTGSTSSGAGHAFVCDGYDGNGYYHINWGWGSYCDGNFLLTNLTPEDQGTGGSSGGYNNNQTALIGAVPNGGSTPPVGTSVVLNATNFPDAKFRAYISNKTGVAEGGTLSEEKLKSVTSIYVTGTSSANGGITSLKGVEHFTALKTLYCSNNQLPSLDVSHNTALKELHCGNNQLPSLDVSHNTALIELDCSNNQLPSLDVSHNTALTELYCYSNQLTSLDVSHNTALITLSCYSNQLTSLDVSHNTVLTSLSCYSNQLSSLDVSHNTALITLSCSSNQLSSLDVSHNTTLTTLDCYHNQLTSLDVSHNTALYWLHCSNNQLSSLDVSHNTALTQLYCHYNQLPSLDVSHNTALTTLSCYSNQLMSLDLSKCTKLESGYTSVSSQSKSVVASSLGSNQYSIDVPADLNLSKVSSFTVNSVSVTPTLSNGKLQFTSSTVPTSVTYKYNTDNNVVGNMKVTVTVTSIEEASGIVLNATNFPDAKFRAYISNLTGVAEGGTLSEEKLKSVTSIDVRGTYSANGGITSLKGVEHFTALTQLYCSCNQLTSLDVSHNTALTELSCEYNKLSSLDVSHNTALTTLNCSSNKLSSLDVSQNTALTKLYCYYNQLPSLDVSQNTALTSLWCFENQLPSLDVSHNTALEALCCEGNQLSTLDVSHNTALTRLDCSNNQLSSLDVSHNTALTELHCYYNQLTSLDVSHNTALTTLICSSNQLPSLDVSHNTALINLGCYNNQLTSLDVSHNTALITLYCENNQLSSLDVSQNTALTNLECYDNQLTSLDMSHNTALTKLSCYSNQLMNLDLSKCTKLKSGYTLVSSQSKSVVASSLGSNQYSIDVPADFNLSKVSSFTVNSVSVTPTLSNGKLKFTSSTVPTSVTYQYNTDNSVVGNMEVTVTVTSIEEASGVVLNATNFPDAKFRAYISNKTGVAEGGTLSEEKLKSVTSINVSGTYSANGGITSLKGVEHFTALKKLYCAYNQLPSLDVSHNTALTELSCYSNQLPSLDVSHNTALTQLSCHYNQLPSLDVSQNTALTSLRCDNNQLPSLDVSQNTALEYLYCSSNQLTSLDVSHNTALEYLHCSNNQLSSLDVSHNTALTELYCSTNQLPSLDVSHNTALTELYCDRNQLTSLDVSQNTALTELSCYSNQLPSLDVSHNTALKKLYCAYNQLPSLDVSHNTALTQLSCHNNQLSSLDVSHNTALTTLECYRNQLPSLDVSHNTALYELFCSNNQLMSLDLSKCTKLQSNSTSVSSQSISVIAYSLGSNQYSIDVPADFNLSKVSSFTVNSVSVTPTLSNGKLQFTSSAVPTSVTYQYNTDNSVVGNMSVTVDIMAIEDVVPANTVYMDDMEVMTGMEETLSVKMKNEVPMEGFEFDLYVPEGVTVATDGDGFPEVYLSTERTTARKTNSFDAIFLPDGGVRVLAASTNGSAISGNDGEIVTVKVNIGADMAEGDYTVLLKNIALSGTDAVSYPTEQMSSTLHVTYGILGDANRDKRVDVADFTTTAHHILGKNPDPFNNKAANANRDERIDVGDLTAIAHIILYGSVDKPTNGANGLPRRAPATDSGEQGGEGYPTNYVYINPVSAESGTEQTLSVNMKNAVDAEGFEFDLYLPEGMSFVLDADGFPEATLSTERTTTRKTNSFDAVIQPDGALRVLAASTNGSVISGHDGEVAQVKVRIDGDVPTGTYLLTLKEIAVSDVDCVSHRTDELVSDITVESGSPTSLGGVVTDGDDDNTYYNMSGQRINKPTRSGVYIQRGKKVVVK